ncbi:MAG: hypothetical protein U9N52_13315 [Campylobacterota bacterium]|nr:hypothetical protein [Campylobacterota bacterium]
MLSLCELKNILDSEILHELKGLVSDDLTLNLEKIHKKVLSKTENLSNTSINMDGLIAYEHEKSSQMKTMML